MVEKLEFSVEDFYNIPNEYFKRLGFSLKKEPPAQTKREKLIKSFNSAYFVFCMVGLCTMMAAEAAHDIVNINNRKPENLAYIMTITFTIFKTITIYKKRDYIAGLFHEIGELYGNKKIELKQCRDLIIYLKAFLRSGKITIVAFAGTLITWSIINGPQQVFERLWLPFDTDRVWLFPIFICYINFLSVIVTFIQFANESLVLVLIVLTSTLFDNLRDDLDEVKTAKESERLDKIRTFVDRHVKLFEWSKKLEDTFSTMFIIHLIESSIAICSSVSQLCSVEYFSERLMFFSFLFQVLGQILSVCYFGQKIIDGSLSISQAIYCDLDWYSSNENVKKACLLMIQRSQKEQMLTAKRFRAMSLETFTSVLTSAYSYYTLLEHLYGN